MNQFSGQYHYLDLALEDEDGDGEGNAGVSPCLFEILARKYPPPTMLVFQSTEEVTSFVANLLDSWVEVLRKNHPDSEDFRYHSSSFTLWQDQGRGLSFTLKAQFNELQRLMMRDYDVVSVEGVEHLLEVPYQGPEQWAPTVKSCWLGIKTSNFVQVSVVAETVSV